MGRLWCCQCHAGAGGGVTASRGPGREARTHGPPGGASGHLPRPTRWPSARCGHSAACTALQREDNVIPRERDGDTDRQVLLIRGGNEAGPPGHGECGLLKVCPRPGSGLLGTRMHLPMEMMLQRAAPQAPGKPGGGGWTLSWEPGVGPGGHTGVTGWRGQCSCPVMSGGAGDSTLRLSRGTS